MIHYHGTPIGGIKADAARFIRGRHALVPYADRKDLGFVAEFAASFIFDNSAFTFWQQGGAVDVPGYVRWVEQWAAHPGLDWALIPDVIGGGEAENDALLREWPASLDRLGVPVYHLDEPPDRLARLVRQYPRVALGSSGEWRTPGARAWWQRMAAVMAAACDAEGRPLARLHGLRMLDPRIFSRLPLASADSTNAAVNRGSIPRFGMYVPASDMARAAVIADRIEAHNSAPVWQAEPETRELLAV